jgi:hypothetical protein
MVGGWTMIVFLLCLIVLAIVAPDFVGALIGGAFVLAVGAAALFIVGCIIFVIVLLVAGMI